MAVPSFSFDSYEISPDYKEALFHFTLQDPNGIKHNFTEKLILPIESFSVKKIPQELLHTILFNLHLMLGISYWKLYCPAEIVLNTGSLSEDQAKFWNIVYTKGLGEFFYKNKIDFRELVRFPHSSTSSWQAVTHTQQDRALLGIGGGKDSLVSMELLRQSNIPFSGFVVETQKPYPLIEHIIQDQDLETIKVRRIIDPHLFELQKQDHHTYNGHIPISAVYAFIGLLTAAVLDFQHLIVSNERSASIGNTTMFGKDINHQWSKSIEFEQLLTSYVSQHISHNISYFSLLRPMSEYHIAKVFSRYPQYFEKISSCNRNFTILSSELDKHALWCGNCAKCAFAFGLLSAFLPAATLVEIFGKNLFNDPLLVPIFKQLLGLLDMKPFDCVGTFEETQTALWRASEKPEFTQTPVIQMFLKEFSNSSKDFEKIEQELLSLDSSALPSKFQAALQKGIA